MALNKRERDALNRARSHHLRTAVALNRNTAQNPAILRSEQARNAVETVSAPGYAGRKNKRSKSGRGQGAWSASMFYRTASTHDKAWDRTVSNAL